MEASHCIRQFKKTKQSSGLTKIKGTGTATDCYEQDRIVKDNREVNGTSGLSIIRGSSTRSSNGLLWLLSTYSYGKPHGCTPYMGRKPDAAGRSNTKLKSGP